MKKEIDKSIGLRIRRQREAMGYSREKLAELSGVAVSFLGSVELGKCDFTVTTLRKLCGTLGISADAILFDKNQNGGSEEIAAMISGLDEKYRPMLLELVGAFVKTVVLAERKE